VVTLHLANELVNALGLPLGLAIALIERIGQVEGSASIEIFSAGHLTIDVAKATSHVTQRLAQAVEVTPVPKRGRPATK